MYLRALFFIVLSLLALTNGDPLQGTIDVKRLQSILEEGIKSKDITSIYYGAKGLKLLKVEIPNICDDLKTLSYDLKNIEQIFQLTNAAALTGCQNSLRPDVTNAATQTLDKKDATIPELYHAVFTLKALGKGSVYDKEDALKNIIQILKKDDSPANYGYAFALCEHMGCTAWTTTHAEGVLLAADESDSKALHFEGGLPVTSLLLTTIIRSYKSQNKPRPLSAAQRTKFAEYLVSRRGVHSARGAALLLDAAFALADDEPSPVSISIKGRKYITAEADSIAVSVTDVVGRPARGVRPDDVLAQSATRLADDVVVLSKQPLTPAADGTTYVLNLSKIKAQYGMYKVALSAGAHSLSVNVAVLGDIAVSRAELGVGDADGTTSPKLTAVDHPQRLPQVLQADHMQKMSLKFTVRDKYSKPVSVQQAFVRVAAAGGDAETIFVAEHDNTKAYKVELNVGALAKHLQHVSGVYSLTLYVGDSAAAGPLAWHLADVHFSFAKDGVALADFGRAGAGGARGPLAEIAHEFRTPEARPARLVSDVFAALCAAPLLLLLLLWARLGLNLAQLPLTPSAPLFHLALGASLGLYGMLWLQLSMFETLRYLLPLGALTFLSGHRLLRRLAADKAAPAR